MPDVVTERPEPDTSAPPLAAQQTDHTEAGNRFQGFGKKP
jgi:hypothetical protein